MTSVFTHVLIIYFLDDDEEGYMRSLYDQKRAYNQTKENHFEDKILDEQIADIFDTHKVDDFSRDWLYTLIITM